MQLTLSFPSPSRVHGSGITPVCYLPLLTHSGGRDVQGNRAIVRQFRMLAFSPFSQVESMELASLLSVASPRSLILVDEMCKGTEPDHGAALLAAALEALDASGCLGVVSTHFHRLLPLPLSLSRVQRRAMSVRREGEGGRARRVPTWMLVDGECR